MTDEIWKNINVEYYGEKYQISTYGRVKSLHVKNERIIKQSLRSEYYGIQLNLKGKYKTFSIHRLVALTFIDNPNNYPIVNHKNGNKLDNKLENLEWVDSKENYRHAKEISLITARTYRVSQYSISGELINIFDSIKEASVKLGISDNKISLVCKGKRNKVGGFYWKYTDFIWKDITKPDGKSFPLFSNYIVTRDGKIYSNSHKKFISQRLNSGYKYVTLYNYDYKTKIKTKKDIAVHILVASLFLENPRKLPYVNHKNYNRSDNNVENLEWCSPSENMVHFSIKNRNKDMLV